jgi:hypothetical protein
MRAHREMPINGLTMAMGYKGRSVAMTHKTGNTAIILFSVRSQALRVRCGAPSAHSAANPMIYMTNLRHIRMGCPLLYKRLCSVYPSNAGMGACK